MERQIYKKILTLGSLSLSIFTALHSAESSPNNTDHQKFQMPDNKTLLIGCASAAVVTAALYLLYRSMHVSSKDDSKVNQNTPPTVVKKSREPIPLSEEQIANIQNAVNAIKPLNGTQPPSTFNYPPNRAKYHIDSLADLLIKANNSTSLQPDDNKIFDSLNNDSRNLIDRLREFSRCMPGSTQYAASKEIRPKIQEKASSLISQYESILQNNAL
jgi:hypothetical protein